MRKLRDPVPNPSGDMNADGASIAIAALSWLSADGEMISRFCAVTGIEPGQIRDAAREPGFLAGVMDFILAHEPTLLRFCEDNGLDPLVVQRAGQALAGGPVPGPGDLV